MDIVPCAIPLFTQSSDSQSSQGLAYPQLSERPGETTLLLHHTNAIGGETEKDTGDENEKG